MCKNNTQLRPQPINSMITEFSHFRIDYFSAHIALMMAASTQVYIQILVPLQLMLHAHILKTGARRPVHRSILELDKSIEPFPTQIAEVCDILGIQLRKADLLSKDLGDSNIQNHGPREEWILRWLLKNLQCSDLQPSR